MKRKYWLLFILLIYIFLALGIFGVVMGATEEVWTSIGVAILSPFAIILIIVAFGFSVSIRTPRVTTYVGDDEEEEEEE